MIGQIKNPLVQELVYWFLGYAVLTAIVFSFIYPDLAQNDGATVFGGIIISMILGLPFLLLALMVYGCCKFSGNLGGGSGGGGGCGGGG